MPIALDLFCGGGGASMGLHRAGFTVIGIDNKPQPEYPFDYIQAEWHEPLSFLLSSIDFVWASPPCQKYIRSGLVNKKDRPDLLGPVRDRLLEWGGTFVIENVPGAPMRNDLTLCGSHFGLKVRRHRWFECHGFSPPPQPKCDHSYPIVGVYGNPHGVKGPWPTMLPGSVKTWREAMGIDWLSQKPLSQAIPPAYSEYIVKSLIEDVE